MNFRRVVIALAALALFASLAGAQTIIPGALSCTVSAASTPSLRAEGKTDLVGDVLIRCTGGLAPAGVLPQAINNAVDITVDYGTPINSRNNPNWVIAGTTYTATEALLMIDDPNSVGAAGAAVPGYGMNAPVKLCAIKVPGSSGSAAPACATNITNSAAPATTGYWIADDNLAAGSNAPNAYQGVLTGPNKVTFYGVPVVQPVTAGVYRQFRVTNVRVAPSTATINATVSIAGGAANMLQVSGALTAAVGTGVAGIAPSSTNGAGGAGAANFSVCITPGPQAAGANATTPKPWVATLSFKENFATAAKAQAPAPAATLTYGSSNFESGIITAAQSGVTPGLADAGTRFVAKFAGLPYSSKGGAQPAIWVSAFNVKNDFLTNVGSLGGTNPIAMLSAAGEAAAWAAPAAPTVFTYSNTATAGAIAANQLTVASDGTATAVWEVAQSSASSSETFNFAVFIQYGTATPNLSNATVTLYVGPNNPSATAAVQIPQFSTSPTAQPVLNIVPCQTSLLFPFVTNQAGFETGVAISNTSSDPFGTATSAGTCSLNFFGANQPSAASTTSSVAAGTTYAATVSSLGLVNFQGYLVANCNFQYAHGFAFVQGNAGASNSTAMGYLPLVLTNTNRGQFLAAEELNN